MVGSCRVRDILFNAYPDEEEKKSVTRGSFFKTVWYGFSSFSHTTLQAIQYINYFRGADLPPAHIQPMIFDRVLNDSALKGIDEVRDKHLNDVDVFVIEISTLNCFSCGEHYFNQSYLERNLVRPNGKPMLAWLRSLSKEGETHSEIINETLDKIRDGKTELTDGLEEMVRGTQMNVMSYEELKSSFQDIACLLGVPCVFVPPFNTPETPIKKKLELTRLIAELSKDIGFSVFDTTGVVESAGRENALAGNGADVNHYAVGFHKTLIKEFVPFLKEAYQRAIDGESPLDNSWKGKEEISSLKTPCFRV